MLELGVLINRSWQYDSKLGCKISQHRCSSCSLGISVEIDLIFILIYVGFRVIRR